MKRNIKIAYILTALKNSWFWLGIWVFYYLLFTNYAGIGIIETGLIVGMTLGEIPTGAIADLLGKKKTLLISFSLTSAGLFGIGFAPNLLFLIISVFFSGVGTSFYSGTLEALVYDSLKEEKQENRYAKVIASIGSLQLISPAFAIFIGGFLYYFSPRLPFLLHGLFYFIGFILCLFLIEPHIDSEKFSLAGFIEQTKQGFRELSKNKKVLSQTLLFLSVGGIIVIADEMLNGFLGVEFGFNEQMAGILWAVIYLLSSLSSQLTPKLLNYLNENKSLIIVGGLMGISFIISPYIGLLLGGTSLLFRSSLQVMFSNLSSIVINKNTESKYRATTLSTFNMLKNIPYVLTAFFIGSLADKFSAKIIAFWLGIILFGLLFFQIRRREKL